MKSSHRKLLGLAILFILFLPLILSFAEAIRAGQQQALNRTLIGAIRKNDTALVIALLAKGADANLKSKAGKTALSIAQRRNYTESIRLLKKAGARQ